MSKIMTVPKAKFTVLLLAIIVLFDFVVEELLHLPTWPVMLCMMFFMLLEEDKKMMPNILFGGCFGLISSWAAPYIIAVFSPSIGDFWGKMIFICLLVLSIVLFKSVAGVVFNTYAFIFCTVASIAKHVYTPNYLLWIILELVGGFLIMLGVWWIREITITRPAKKKAEAMKQN